MSPRVFLILAAITVVTTVAAIFAVLSQPAVTTLQLAHEPAFPALRENPDAVAKVILSTADGTITLVRETGDRWSALERYGYPVDGGRVRELVVTLADMRLIEPKTAQPEHYDRLQVEAPDAEGAQSQLVRLEAADGQVLAEAIIGKQRYRLTGTEPSGTYVRRPDEAQSWLASGGIQIDREVARWLDAEIVDVDPEVIRRIEIERAGEPGYVAVRDEPGADLRLTDLAADETLKEDADLTRLTGALSSMALEDVKPREQIEWPTDQHIARIETFEGVELTVRLAQIDDGHWATFEASGTTRPEGAAAAEPQAAAREPDPVAADDAEGEPQGGADEAAAEHTAAQESAPPLDPTELNQRLGKWAYQIPEYLFDRLSTARSELVADQDGTS